MTEIFRGAGIGTTVEKAELNPSNARLLDTIECQLKMTGAQSIGASGYINWDAEDRDTDAFHSNAVNPSRMTAPFAGTYLITGNLTAGGAAGTYDCWIQVNRGTEYLGHRIITAGAETYNHVWAEEIRLAAGDYVEIEVAQTSGANRNYGGAARYQAYATMRLVGV